MGWGEGHGAPEGHIEGGLEGVLRAPRHAGGGGAEGPGGVNRAQEGDAGGMGSGCMRECRQGGLELPWICVGAVGAALQSTEGR